MSSYLITGAICSMVAVMLGAILWERRLYFVRRCPKCRARATPLKYEAGVLQVVVSRECVAGCGWRARHGIEL